MSLFAYAGAPLTPRAQRLAQSRAGVARGSRGLRPPPRSRPRPGARTIRRNAHDGGSRREVEISPCPFLAQDRYDELLWACDVNFVRGEDSFVRAQWAARPFVWHIYPQDEGAHWVKLAAFLARYTAGLDRTHAAAVTGLWEAWNAARPGRCRGSAAPALGEAWAAFVARPRGPGGARPAVERGARRPRTQFRFRGTLAEAFGTGTC